MIFGAKTGSHHHHRGLRQIGMFPDALGEHQAVHFRQLAITQYDAKRFALAAGPLQLLQCLGTIGHHPRSQTPVAEHFAQNLSMGRIVIDDQNRQFAQRFQQTFVGRRLPVIA